MVLIESPTAGGRDSCHQGRATLHVEQMMRDRQSVRPCSSSSGSDVWALPRRRLTLVLTLSVLKITS